MIDDKMVRHIREYGVYHNSGAARAEFLFEELGLAKDQKAEYILLSGCRPPENVPQAFGALKKLLELWRVSYSFLSKETCCGWMPLGQPAVMAKNDGDIARAQELAKTFIMENCRQAEALGAKSVVLFCAACEPTYSNFREATRLEVISFSELINHFFRGGKLSLEADYYAGCYRFRRRITSRPVDIEPGLRILEKIQGLKLNLVDNNLCCYIPGQMEKLVQSLRTQTVITLCTGCTQSLRRNLKGDHQIRMLPEIVWQSVEGQK
jgi:Fe-S oxidoreductase